MRHSGACARYTLVYIVSDLPEIFLEHRTELAAVDFLLALFAIATAAAALALCLIGVLKATKQDRKKAVPLIGLCLSCPTLLFSVVVLILSM